MSTSHFPVPSMLTVTETSVSRVERFMVAVRGEGGDMCAGICTDGTGCGAAGFTGDVASKEILGVRAGRRDALRDAERDMRGSGRE